MIASMSLQEQIDFLEKNFDIPEDRAEGLKFYFSNLMETQDFLRMISAIEELLTVQKSWLPTIVKLKIMEESIIHCSEEIYLFELIGTMKEYINRIFETEMISEALAVQIVSTFKQIAEIFARQGIYQTAIDLYSEAITIGKSFKIPNENQAILIYDLLRTYESLERMKDAFELAFLGYKTVEHSPVVIWRHLFERTLEVFSSHLIQTYLRSAEGMAWEGDLETSKNQTINALRVVAVLLRIKEGTTHQIRTALDQIRTVMVRQRLVGQEEVEIYDILGQLMVKEFKRTKIKTIADSLIKYCDLAFIPSISVLLVIYKSTPIYSITLGNDMQKAQNRSIFKEEGQVLFSALLSAVSSSMEETLGGQNKVKHIEYGSQTIVVESRDEVDILLLVDRETTELRESMIQFLENVLSKGFVEMFADGIHSKKEYRQFLDPIIREAFNRYIQMR